MAQRNTWQRDRVREALGDAPGFVSAQDLHAALRDENTGIGLATVYRALATLAASGEADQLQSPEGEAIYRACSTTGHHHHLICRSCGKAVEIEAREVERGRSAPPRRTASPPPSTSSTSSACAPRAPPPRAADPVGERVDGPLRVAPPAAGAVGIGALVVGRARRGRFLAPGSRLPTRLQDG
jgi:Fur family ferric uptake transcriptional regulator